MARRSPFKIDAEGHIWWVTRRYRREVFGLHYWTGTKFRRLPPRLHKLVPKMMRPKRPVTTDYHTGTPGSQPLGKYDELRSV